MTDSDCSPIDVAAGVLRDADGRVLVARRPDGAHQGGLWEFPGGKRLDGEDSRAALQRELLEELGIEVVSARPLIRVDHDYVDVQVHLDTWLVESWRGDIGGREGQPLAWVSPQALRDYPMPPADRPILDAIQLPPLCLVTPEPAADHESFLVSLASALNGGVDLVQLRAHTLGPEAYLALLERALAVCESSGAQLVANLPSGVSAEAALAAGAHGVHLSGARLAQAESRPVPATCWLSAACHDEQQLRQAQATGCDFMLLSPVCSTLTHPDSTPLGWRRFAELVATVNRPVYALGGMQRHDCSIAWQAGAQGIAALRALWPDRAGED